jgi:3-hydroxymyristoyl/3-hydroxydecanoyl-(acyl carrier protein) dehydratase
MSFLFVTRIHNIGDNRILGRVNYTSGEPWRQEHPDGSIDLSTGVVSEAIGQLVSWLALKNNDFTARPVFLFASKIHLDSIIVAPAEVELEAWITSGDRDSFIFSGTAKVGGKIVVEIVDCGGYFMPLAELEDPAKTRLRFNALLSTGVDANPSGEMYSRRQLIDVVKEIDPGQSISAAKVMRQNESFYADHFPRFPVTPIVVINEMIAEATRIMMQGSHALAVPPPNAPRPVAVMDLKIKSFIRPSDTVLIHIKRIEAMDATFETIAEVIVNQKKILRGRYRYKYNSAGNLYSPKLIQTSCEIVDNGSR